MKRSTHWFALMDGRRVRLVRAGRTGGGRWHADEVGSLENQWEDEHETGRPAMLAQVAGRGGTPTHAAATHTDDEARKRFMRDAVSWLERRLDEHGIDLMHVFAPAKTLGEWRQLHPTTLNGRVREVECDLCTLPTGELVDHARVREVLRG